MSAAPINFKILLDQVNRLRNAVDGMEPLPRIPQGDVFSADYCPIARALSNGVRASVDDDEIIFYYPAKTTLDELAEATNRIKTAGFKILKGEHSDTWSSSLVRRINVMPTTTMVNFIKRFDAEELTDYIESYEEHEGEI